MGGEALTDSLSYGMVVWVVEITATGLLGWWARALRRDFPALFFFLAFSALSQLLLIPLFIHYNTYYGPYWYGRNAYQAVETFAFVVVLGELAGATRKGVIAGVLLALGASTGLGEAQTPIAIVLALLSALAAFSLDEPRGVIAQGVLVQVAIPAIALVKPEAMWLRWVPPMATLLALLLWAYAFRLMRKERPGTRAAAAGR